MQLQLDLQTFRLLGSTVSPVCLLGGTVGVAEAHGIVVLAQGEELAAAGAAAPGWRGAGHRGRRGAEADEVGGGAAARAGDRAAVLLGAVLRGRHGAEGVQ